MNPVEIIGVHVSLDPRRVPSALHFFEGVARVIEHRLIGMEQSALLIQDDDVLGKEIDELPQLLLLLTELVLRPAPILYVRPRRVPAQDATLLVPKRVVVNEVPAVLPIMAPGPPLQAERNAACERQRPLFLQPLDVVGVKDQLARICARDLLRREAVVLERCATRAAGLPLRIENDDRLGNRVEDALRLVFRVLAIFDIGTEPGDDAALLVPHWRSAA